MWDRIPESLRTGLVTALVLSPGGVFARQILVEAWSDHPWLVTLVVASAVVVAASVAIVVRDFHRLWLSRRSLNIEVDNWGWRKMRAWGKPDPDQQEETPIGVLFIIGDLAITNRTKRSVNLAPQATFTIKGDSQSKETPRRPIRRGLTTVESREFDYWATFSGYGQGLDLQFLDNPIRAEPDDTASGYLGFVVESYELLEEDRITPDDLLVGMGKVDIKELSFRDHVSGRTKVLRFGKIS